MPKEFLDKVELAAFDWDGTVVDSVPYKLRQNQDLAAEFGNNLSIAEVREIWNDSKGFPDLMQKLCQTQDMSAIMEVVNRDYNNPEYAKRNFEDAAGTLHKLRTMGIKTAILTNLTADMLEKDAADLKFDLEKYFDYIQTADQYDYKKPDSRVFNPLKQYFAKIAAKNILYIGDEMKDYTAAIGAGIRFVGVSTGMTSRTEFDEKNIPNIESIRDL